MTDLTHNAPEDPVLARRRHIERWASLGRRSGYALYSLALLVFLLGRATGFTTATAVVAGVALLAGSVILAPSIIVGYGVKAADRADREGDW